MKLNLPCNLAFAAAAAALLGTSTPLIASEVDDNTALLYRNTYVYRTYLKDDNIKTEVKDRVITLTGTVADEAHKTLAEETAWNLPGVARVDSQLVTKAEVATEKADALIGRKVNLSLMFHRNVSAAKTGIEVTDGVVTLKGEAANDAQKALTSEYAKDVAGVKAVKNEMTVAKAQDPAARTEEEKLDDASVTAQVRTALMTHLSTYSIKVKVVTRNGNVGLTGVAKNDAEKSLVTKLVSDIQGVTSVKNEMTVAQVVTK